MPLTPYHAKLFATELTLRAASGSLEGLATALSEAQVELNPHQIEAALFAFRSPLSRGAILADEVGLGKTIEAGLLLAQRWAERRRRLLVICPANLRKQWSQEMADKFFLPTTILETKTFNEAVRNGNLNPFEQSNIVICSYQFARSKEPYLRQTEWDLVVMDEAHRLRNVYKPGNKIGKAIKSSLAIRQKVLLTATPLQNSLDELYGLVSIVDEFTFGDLRSFRKQFRKAERAVPLTLEEEARLRDEVNAGVIGTSLMNRIAVSGVAEHAALRQRLKPICQRTLRRDVRQYVNYTNRHALVQEFVPGADEQRLYDMVSEYLQQPNLYALPAGQRQLMTLILRKLLASSTYAITATLAGLAERLEAAEAQSEASALTPELEENFELLPELEEEWEDDGAEDDGAKPARVLSPEEREERRAEIARLREFHLLASSIHSNSKGEQLLTALKRGFARAEEAQAGRTEVLQQKAIIFTESRRTQDYLLRLLDATEFAGKVVLFNGTNTDDGSQRIYREWLQRHKGTSRISGSATADKRQALVEYFRDEASIMIATEAAAEGINLQFCNLVVNYDLPWNPQRIEQRIGRCHRYGQKFDVVVVNFLNRENAADVRVYQLLAEKFQLFDGVFGASDEVLGAIESGVDFEKRIAGIYQQCRTPQQISLQFNQLQQELEGEIGAARQTAHTQLLNNFDAEVIEKVRLGSQQTLSRFQALLWRLTRIMLAGHAEFPGDGHSFTLRTNPFADGVTDVPLGRYEMRKGVEDASTWRIGTPLAQRMIREACNAATPVSEVTFVIRENANPFGVMGELRGRSGWLTCAKLSLESSQPQDHVLFAGTVDEFTRDGHTFAARSLDAEACRLLFDQQNAWVSTPEYDNIEGRQYSGFNATIRHPELSLMPEGADAAMQAGLLQQQQWRVEEAGKADAAWLDTESSKLDRWADDRRLMLDEELRELDEAIRETKKQALAAGMLPQKLALTQEVQRLEAERSRKRRDLFEAQDQVDTQRFALYEEASRRLGQQAVTEPLFTLRWRVE